MSLNPNAPEFTPRSAYVMMDAVHMQFDDEDLFSGDFPLTEEDWVELVALDDFTAEQAAMEDLEREMDLVFAFERGMQRASRRGAGKCPVLYSCSAAQESAAAWRGKMKNGNGSKHSSKPNMARYRVVKQPGRC